MPNKYQWLTSKELYLIVQLQNQVYEEGINLDRVLNLIAEKSNEIINADGAVVELLEGDELVYRAVAGQPLENLGMRVKKNASLSGTAIQQKQILICDDSETDERVDRQACRRVGLRSMLVAPLYKGSTIVGVLKVLSNQPQRFGEREVIILQILSQIISTAIYLTERYGNNQLYLAATTDMLTGIRNRAYFYDRLHSSFITARETQRPFLVIMADMDGLKRINDSWGHRYGDTALVEFTHRIKAALRVDDVFARLGGDEFGVLLNNLDGLPSPQQLIERLESRISQAFVVDEHDLPLSASFGYALYTHEMADITNLMDAADQAMYQNKRLKNKRLKANKVSS